MMGSKNKNWRVFLATVALTLGCGTSGTVTPKPPEPISKREQIDRCLKGLSDPDPIRQAMAAASLGSLGKEAQEALPELKKLENTSNPELREVVRNSIKAISEAK